MDAGTCSACQSALGELDPAGMLGLFPRMRCGGCGLVNVLTGAAEAGVPTGASVAISTAYGAQDYAEDIEPEAAFNAEPEPTRVGIETGIDFNQEPEPTRIGIDFNQ